MANICRLCGNSEHEAIFIFGNEAMKHQIDLKISVGLDIQIFPDDPLPKHACVCCLGKLDEFCTFQHHCRRVQTKLRRLLPEQALFQVQDINCDLHQNSKTSTEESSAHIEMFETLVDSTDIDVNNPFDLKSTNNGNVEVGKIKGEADLHVSSNNSVHSYNESLGDDCDPLSNDSYSIKSELLIATETSTSQAACQLDSYCQDREEDMSFSADGFTSESAFEHKSVTVEEVSEVQADLASKKTDLRNSVLGRFETLFVNDDYVTSNSFSAIPEDSLLMEEEISNGHFSNTDSRPLQVIHSEDDCADISDQNMETSGKVSEVIDLVAVTNENEVRRTLQLNTALRSDSNINCESKGHSVIVNSGNSATCVHGIDAIKCIFKKCCDSHPVDKYWKRVESRFCCLLCKFSVGDKYQYKIRRHICAHRSFNCDSALNTLRHPLLKKKVTCKTTRPATFTCLQNISVQGVHDAEITPGNGSDSSQQLVISTELPLNHPNHVGRGATNVSSVFPTSHNEISSDDNPRYLSGKVYNTSPQVTGKLMRNTIFDSNGHFINTDSQPLQVMHSEGDCADISDQNMETSGKVSEVIDLVDVTNENEARRTLQRNPTFRSDSNIKHKSKGHSVIVNSVNSATCVHGINASKCIFKKCCDSHPVDKYWNTVESRLCCLLCKFSVGDKYKYKIRRHICAHLSFNRDSALKTLRHPLLKKKVTCKTTRPATVTCFQNISVQGVHDAEISQGNGSDSSQQSVISTELPLNHPNHVGRGATNVSSVFPTSHNETSSDDNPRYLLGKVYNTSPQVTGKLMRNTIFDSNGHFINTDSQPLQVIHSEGDCADISDQNMKTSGKVSEVIDLVADTNENEVCQTLQLNTASCSDSNINRESKGHSVIVNSGNSATCVHGIDASKCIFKKCCDSHLVDEYWKRVESRFCCLLCKFSVGDKYKYQIRGHICAHLSLKHFECSICCKKFNLFAKLCKHIQSHGKKYVSRNFMARGTYSCDSCSKTFKYKSYLHSHRIRTHVVPQNLQINTALLSEADIKHEFKEH